MKLEDDKKALYGEVDKREMIMDDLGKKLGINVQKLYKSTLSEKFAKKILEKEGEMLMEQREDIINKELLL